VGAVRDPASHQSEQRARLGRGPAARLDAEPVSAAAGLAADLVVPLEADLLVPPEADLLAPLVPLARPLASLPVLRQPPLPAPERVLPEPNQPSSRPALSLLSSWVPVAARSPASL
jgi:hypothetical protein